MVKEYEDIILPPPKQFRDRPPKPTRKPHKGHANSYEIELQDNLNPLNHFTKTRPQTESHLKDLLKTMRGFKFIETLEVTFEKDAIDSKTGKRVSIYKTAFFNGKAKTITNNKKRSHTQLDSRKRVIAFQDRVMTINIKEAQHPLKQEKQVIDKSSIMLKISTKSMHRVLV